VLLAPRLRKTTLRNLEIAFPERDHGWRLALYKQSFSSLSRMFVDFARLHTLDKNWVEKHVSCAYLPRFEELKRNNPEKGVLIATGHLGSFELLAHCVAMFGYPISFVVRNFTLPRVDRWWRSVREAYGNRVIARRGAFREMVSDLNRGRDVAVLFDQNLTRNHALFVDWFGVPAATTKSLGLAALRSAATVIVASIRHVSGDNYCIDVVECDFSKIYADTNLSVDEKLVYITTVLSKEYESMIRRSPASWFWMHRRWRTRPTEQEKNIYD